MMGPTRKQGEQDATDQQKEQAGVHWLFSAQGRNCELCWASEVMPLWVNINSNLKKGTRNA